MSFFGGEVQERDQSKPVLQTAKEFLGAGKQRLAGTTRQADSAVVKAMRQESEQMKLLISELTLKNHVLTPALAGGAGEKSLRGLGDETCDD